MSLPELIEIIPPSRPVDATVTVPGSKSITNRALVLAALAPRATVLRGALWSEDTQIMVEALRRLGLAIVLETDLNESCNRTIRVQGGGPVPPPGGTKAAPLELHVGNAGTAARFLAALVCLGSGYYRLDGVPRMRQRPQQALFQALRMLGYEVAAEGDRLPAVIRGMGPRPGRCHVDIRESSQFASALLLAASAGGWEIVLAGENADESPYVDMTRSLVREFGRCDGEFQIEPDASSGSYFWAADAIQSDHFGPGHRIQVAHWPTSGWQIDAEFPRFLPLPPVISRQRDLGDSIMTSIVLGPLARRPTAFTDLQRLRVQECERVQALRQELTRCGAQVSEEGQTLRISPGSLHGAEIETYHDHRMAMCFAILGLKVPGVRLKNPACVKKTFPNFFQKLAAPPPEGLGVRICHGHLGHTLAPQELFAD